MIQPVSNKFQVVQKVDNNLGISVFKSAMKSPMQFLKLLEQQPALETQNSAVVKTPQNQETRTTERGLGYYIDIKI